MPKIQKTKSKTLSLRASPELAIRIEAVAETSRRTPAAVLAICVEDHLPILEEELGIKPGIAAKKVII